MEFCYKGFLLYLDDMIRVRSWNNVLYVFLYSYC